MSPEYRTPTFRLIVPSIVRSPSTQGKSTPNKFFSTSRFGSTFFSSGGGAPGNAGGVGCIASNSAAETVKWIDQILVRPNQSAAESAFRFKSSPRAKNEGTTRQQTSVATIQR